MSDNQVKLLSQKHLEEMKKLRRILHENPEVGYEEVETSKLVQQTLMDLGIEFHSLADTGVVGLIKGEKPGKTVLLRADMDALPIQETANVSYASKKPGLMHACGHDGHTAGLLGAAMILNELKADLQGNVKLMFQPAEETLGGADPMIKAGILENPTVDAAFGLHLWGESPEGKVEVKHGAMMAAPDQFTLKIIGRGGHAAMPHLCIDPINIAMQIINNVQNIVSRRIDPVKPVVISFCRIHAGEALNVIPQEVEIGGTIRTLDREVRAMVPAMMESVIKAICEANGASYELNVNHGYPPIINDHTMTDIAERAIAKIIGAENVSELENPNMGGEDFAYLGEHVPSAFYFFGIAKDGMPKPIHHHPEFQWDDDVLADSSATLAQIAIDFLNQG